ncbi:GNAT family N-acetyltransferase [Pseudalkalibacillus caeni]|uniref:GNAT family N-acetyltransferase n=1 Tax=Exobacillus caeni TaxID=2574798 RepID=A0A5R9F3P1_9BACL|nr:GNAT family N-acetyltransferase [Pseudalkalibacillus caeni]TLS36956.1 GNAT family N-acetyltransferase [Pseudalkalibacillus caeni]
MLSENITFDTFDQQDTDLEQIGELYCKTFLKEGYTTDDKEAAVSNIKKHAGYKGFYGVKGKDTKERIVGFAYGYSSFPDQFYRQKIAAQLTEEQIKHWLSNCFEFVEIAVDPSYKRLGIASRLHDELLSQADHRTSVLTTGTSNNPAIKFYQKKGWMLIKMNAPVLSIESPQIIMGKELI